MEVHLTCPLGHTCEEARDGAIYRCRWFKEYGETDKAGAIVPGSAFRDCAIPMDGLHLTELKKGIRGVQAAVESRGNTLASVMTGAVRSIADARQIQEAIPHKPIEILANEYDKGTDSGHIG